MRRWIVVLMALGLAACADDFVGDAPDMLDTPDTPDAADAAPDAQADMGPLRVCEDIGGIDTMAKLESLSDCEEIFVLYIYGPEIVNLEPLRNLRRVNSFSVVGTKIRTVEPLRNLADVVGDMTFTDNEFMDNCQLTGWAADVKKRDPNGAFGLVLDAGKSTTQCLTWDFDRD